MTRYKQSFRNFTEALGKSLEIEELTNAMVRVYVLKRLEANYAPETVNMDLRHVRAALSGVSLYTMIRRPPLYFEMIPTLRKMANAFSIEEVSRLVTVEESEDFKKFWLFLVWTGVKKSEALSLTWNDLVLDGPDPHVNVKASDGSLREVVILPLVRGNLGSPKTRREKLFPDWTGNQVLQRFNRTAAKAKLAWHRVDDLRLAVPFWASTLGLDQKVRYGFNVMAKNLYGLLCPEMPSVSHSAERTRVRAKPPAERGVLPPLKSGALSGESGAPVGEI